MAKITALPRLAATDATGLELVPVVHGGVTKGVAVADVVAPAAQPFVDAAKLAKDQAADLVRPENIFIDVTAEFAESQVATGAFFKIVETASGVADVRRRTDDASEHLYFETTREALAANGAQKGSAQIGAPLAGTVYDHLQGYVTPEAYAYGAIVGTGGMRPLSTYYATLAAAQAVYPFVTSLNQSVDWAAFQAAVNSKMLVRTRYGANYYMTDELVPPEGSPLIIQGPCWGTYSSIRAVPGFKGYLLRPLKAYDIRDLRVLGNEEDGCFLIGSDRDSGTGGARIERVYIANADVGIYFGGKWQHPWGLYYNQIIGVGFRTGGINLGGASGTPAALSGESAWVMDNININALLGGIPADNVVVTANTDATHDYITWDNSVTPLYGWCVMRSADGATGWHVPPNWASHNYTSGSFSASKVAGETWYYAVVRMTIGMYIRRGKAIACGVVQTEYFGVGTYYAGYSMSIQQFYAETRDNNPPIPQYAGVVAANANLSVGGAWVEQYGYGLISSSNSDLNTLGGKIRANNCRYGGIALGGSTLQSIIHAVVDASGSTPTPVVGLPGIGANGYSRAGYLKAANGAMTHYVDGVLGAGIEARYRGTTKAKMAINAAGEGQIDADRLTVATPSKTLTPLLSNTAFSTALTPGAATAFLTLSGMPANSTAGLLLHYSIGLTADVNRQAVTGTIEISLVLQAGATNPTVSVVGSPAAKAIQNGTITADPAFTYSVSGGVVTILCNVPSSMSAAAILLNYISRAGAGSAALAVTQL